MANQVFDFEKPIVEAQQQLDRLREIENPTPEQTAGAVDLESRLERLKQEIYGNLTVWQRVQLARCMARPRALDYIKRLFRDWTELHGDRAYGDDHACLAGFAFFGERPGGGDRPAKRDRFAGKCLL